MIRIEVTNGPYLPANITRENWRDMMSNAQLWRPVAAEICTAVGLPMSAGLVAGFPGSSAVFAVDERFVIKLFPPLFAGDFAVEQAVYERLGGRIDAMPDLLHAGIYCDRIEWPFLLLQFCAGEPVRDVYPRLSSGEKNRIATQVGLLLQCVQQTAVPPVEPFMPWPAFLRQRHQACLVELREDTPMPGYLVDEAACFLAEMLPRLSREPVHLVNADLTDDHVLLSRLDGSWRMTAVIDWADAQIGPAAYEWVAAWFGLCRRDVTMFRALVRASTPGQAFDESFRRSLLACTFLHRFGPLIIRERWSAEAPPEKLSLKGLANWLWPLPD